MIAVVFSAKKKGESRYEEKIPDRPGAGGARVPAFVVSDRISEGGQKSRPLSPHHRFVIAMHSPDGVLESGLLGCLPEKKVRKPACRIGQDTFSGPLCVKDSRNYRPIRAISQRIAGCFLCTSDSMAERKTFEPSVPFLNDLNGDVP